MWRGCWIDLQQIQTDLNFLDRYEIIIYGSYVSNQMTPRSDIDIAIITRDPDPSINSRIQLDIMGQFNPLYDIRVFEMLPLHIQINIIKNHLVLFGDELELSEYFYFYRKLWNDVKQRIAENQFQDSKEMRKIILQAKEIKKNYPNYSIIHK